MHKSAMSMRDETREAVEHIMDVFSGADGGGEFMAFRLLVEEMDKRAANGDQAAAEVIKVVTKFNKLLLVSRKQMGLLYRDIAEGL